MILINFYINCSVAWIYNYTLYTILYEYNQFEVLIDTINMQISM